jgi:hypothetical protein
MVQKFSGKSFAAPLKIHGRFFYDAWGDVWVGYVWISETGV